MVIRKLSKVVKILVVTSGEPPESAPHLRLKKSKKTSKCQEFFSTVPEKPKSSTTLARLFGFFKHPLSCKISKNWSVEYQKTLKTLKIFRKQCLKMFHPNFENVTSELKFSVKKLNKRTKKWTDRVELTKKTSHCKSRAFLEIFKGANCGLKNAFSSMKTSKNTQRKKGHSKSRTFFLKRKKRRLKINKIKMNK